MKPKAFDYESLLPLKQALIDVGRFCHARGWSDATSSNYSVRLSVDPLRLLITASGRHKGRLGEDDFVVVDDTGQAVAPGPGRPSAETMLHVAAASTTNVGAVLHTHSVWSTVLSAQYFEQGHVELTGYEMLKALEGIDTHEARVRLRIYDNTQNIARLAAQVAADLRDPARPLRYGLLMRAHGLYTWGVDLGEAQRQLEAIEFLLEVVGRRVTWPKDPLGARLPGGA